MFAVPQGYVWHYTAGSQLPAIAQSGGLIPTRSHASAHARHGREILWFSRQQQWEPSAERSRANAALPHLPGHRRPPPQSGWYRFGLARNDARLLPWPDITRLADLDVPQAMTLVSAGLRVGANPTDWVGSLQAVPLSVLRFQAWDGHAWADADFHACELSCRLGRNLPAPQQQPAIAAAPPAPAMAGASHDLH
jgi:hypothetical protein